MPSTAPSRPAVPGRAIATGRRVRDFPSRALPSPKPDTTDAAVRWYGFSIALLAICFAQLHWRAYFLTPAWSNPTAQFIAQFVLILLGPAGCWLACARATEVRAVGVAAAAFSFFCAGYCEVLHVWVVDVQNYDPAFRSNFEWQLHLHSAVLDLVPVAVPHVYRFLPDCIVALFHWLSGSDNVGVHAYRLLANGLLYATIFRYARTYLSPLGALGVMATVAMFYPITILRYNGQFTDPASHLSFALCLYALATESEVKFQCGLFAGIFAKESILAMAVCRAFSGRNRRQSVLAAGVYFVLGLAVTIAIRRYVNRTAIPIEFKSISGTELTQVFGNLGAWRVWWGMYLVTLGALLPGAVAGWRLMDAAFRATCLVIVVATLGTNLGISLMWEERNIVPAFIPLAVLNFKYLETVLPRLLRGGALTPGENRSGA